MTKFASDPVRQTWRGLVLERAGRSLRELEVALASLLREIAVILAELGCPLVGHVKLLALGNEGDWFRASLTSTAGEPDCAGQVRRPEAGFELSLAVIVYGVDATALAERLDRLQTTGLTLEMGQDPQTRRHRRETDRPAAATPTRSSGGDQGRTEEP